MSVSSASHGIRSKSTKAQIHSSEFGNAYCGEHTPRFLEVRDSISCCSRSSLRDACGDNSEVCTGYESFRSESPRAKAGKERSPRTLLQLFASEWEMFSWHISQFFSCRPYKLGYDHPNFENHRISGVCKCELFLALNSITATKEGRQR